MSSIVDNIGLHKRHVPPVGNNPPPPQMGTRRNSSPISYSLTRPASNAVVQTIASSIEKWGLPSLLVKDKQQIVPCPDNMVVEFHSSHDNFLKAEKQRIYFWVGAVAISSATSASTYYANEYLLLSSLTAGMLNCASTALGYFFNMAQSGYLVDLKTKRDKLCQKLKEQYERLGKELIVKYIESSSIKAEGGDEKVNGNITQQHERKYSGDTEREIVFKEARHIINRWNDIKDVSSKRLYIDGSSANDVTLPLYEAALTIVNNYSDSLIAETSNEQKSLNTIKQNEYDTSMQAYFNEQKNLNAIKQKEREKEKSEKEAWQKLYEDIKSNKQQVEQEAAERLELAKQEIAAESAKQAEKAALQIDAARKQATSDATLEANAQLVSAIKRIEETEQSQNIELAKKLDWMTKQIQEDAQKRNLEALEKVEQAISQAAFAHEQASTSLSSVEDIAFQMQNLKEEIIANTRKEFGGTIHKIEHLTLELGMSAKKAIQKADHMMELQRRKEEEEAALQIDQLADLLRTPQKSSGKKPQSYSLTHTPSRPSYGNNINNISQSSSSSSKPWVP